MLRFAMYLLGLMFTLALGICVMVFGWGLSPISWGWVIFGNLAGCVLGSIISMGGQQ